MDDFDGGGGAGSTRSGDGGDARRGVAEPAGSESAYVGRFFGVDSGTFGGDFD